jgi:hypothetical protein
MVQKLLAPSEMGEAVQSARPCEKSDEIAWPGFDVIDRRHRL